MIKFIFKKTTFFILKVVFLIFAIYCFLVLDNYSRFRTEYQVKNSNATKILLVWGKGLGESEQTHRFKIAARRLGIELKTVSEFGGYLDTFVPRRSVRAANAMQPDFVLTIERKIEPIPGFVNYLVLDQSQDYYLTMEIDNQLKFINPMHYTFDGLLPTFQQIDRLQKTYEMSGKKFHGFLWYPTLYQTDYVAQKPLRLFYPGGTLADETRSSKKYKRVFMLLDRTGYLDLFGSKEKWEHTPNSFRGMIPFDGISLIKEHNKAGVALVLHANDHLYGGLPTGRIFEAAAANTVIIADQNPFLMKHFANNILYVDTSEDFKQIFKQIDDHMQWIFSHPDQAQQMAQNCHQIFLQKFTLEAQLQQLIDLHKTREASHLL